MRHAELRAIAHNLADSVGGGCSLLLGIYELDVYGEAVRSPTGGITLDMLRGLVTEGSPSPTIKDAAALCPAALARLCVDAGKSVAAFAEASVRYSMLHRSRPRFTLTVVDAKGKRSSVEYAGIPARRVMLRDDRGRWRPKPAQA